MCGYRLGYSSKDQCLTMYHPGVGPIPGLNGLNGAVLAAGGAAGPGALSMFGYNWWLQGLDPHPHLHHPYHYHPAHHHPGLSLHQVNKFLQWKIAFVTLLKTSGMTPSEFLGRGREYLKKFEPFAQRMANNKMENDRSVVLCASSPQTRLLLSLSVVLWRASWVPWHWSVSERVELEQRFVSNRVKFPCSKQWWRSFCKWAFSFSLLLCLQCHQFTNHDFGRSRFISSFKLFLWWLRWYLVTGGVKCKCAFTSAMLEIDWIWYMST